MKLEMLKAKLHHARVTDANVEYEGSLGIDIELMEAVGLYPYEKVLVANINNGSRLETYAITEPFGSRRMVLNGAAARLGSIGDRIIIMSFCWVDESDVREGRYCPRVIRLDEHNEPVTRMPEASAPQDLASVLEGQDLHMPNAG
jgi:aspartate 1-decarboxylase